MWPPRPTIFPGTVGLPSYDLEERPGGSVKDLSPTGKATSICQGEALNSGHGRPVGVKFMERRTRAREEVAAVRFSTIALATTCSPRSGGNPNAGRGRGRS